MRPFFLVSLCLLLLSAILFAPPTASAYRTERVVLVVIDGLRATEAFEERPWDFIPMMWDSLTPRGTLYPGIYNLGATWTTPAHAQMCSGQREFQPNCGEVGKYTRPQYPTIFEYYNASAGPENYDTFIVTNKWNLRTLTHSLNPAYGAPDSAFMVKVEESDLDVFSAAAEIMTVYEPHLLLIHFGDVDFVGHTGPWDSYLSSISTADTLVYRVWRQLIQRPGSPYNNRTTMIVTTDHGRHGDAYGGLLRTNSTYKYVPGYREHGCLCPGCQHLFLLALGPDTPQGAVCDRRVHQIDICPTIARLFDLSAPYSDGTVLWEMLGQEQPPPSLSREAPQLAVRGGVLHKAWREKGPSTGGRGAIYYSWRTLGSSWSTPTRISSFVDSTTASTEAFFPSLSVDDSNVDIAWSSLGFHDGSGGWQVWHRRSTDAGESWDRAERLVCFSETARDTLFQRSMPNRPCITTRGERVAVFYARIRFGVGYRISAHGGSEWPDDPPLQVLPGEEVRDCAHRVKVAQTPGSPPRLHLVWNDIRAKCYNLYYQHTAGNGMTWLDSDVQLTDYGDDTHVVDMAIAPDDTVLHVIAADNRELGGGQKVFQIYHTCSTLWGDAPEVTWHPVSSSHLQGERPGAIDPALVVAGTDTLYAAWADHKDGNFEIYTSRSLNGGRTWSTPRRQSETPGFSLQPQLAWDRANRRLYLIYQDNTEGSWELSDVYDITYEDE